MAKDTQAHRIHWDNKYLQGNTHANFKPDADLTNLIHHFPSTGLALDMACGTGRNSFFIAEHGLDVVCLDFSFEGLALLKNHRPKDDISQKLHPIQADLSNFDFISHSFDAVFVFRYLDRDAFSQYMHALKPSGLLFFKAFNQNYHKIKPEFNPAYLLNRGELLDSFEQAEIIYTNDSQSISDHESVILIKKY